MQILFLSLSAFQHRYSPNGGSPLGCILCMPGAKVGAKVRYGRRWEPSDAGTSVRREAEA